MQWRDPEQFLGIRWIDRSPDYVARWKRYRWMPVLIVPWAFAWIMVIREAGEDAQWWYWVGLVLAAGRLAQWGVYWWKAREVTKPVG